ncbi:MAG: transcriptional repressor [Myxococcales bacterium]|nr:transcriptional repressor [Myxococcales bacterium]
MGRNTEQRDAIRAVFEASARPLKPEEVLVLAQAFVPALGVATVYRNLKRLCETGELRTVELPGHRTTLYESAQLDHHHHFHCQDCDRVFDVDVCPGSFTSQLPPGFQVNRHDLVLYGACPDCTA